MLRVFRFHNLDYSLIIEVNAKSYNEAIKKAETYIDENDFLFPIF